MNLYDIITDKNLKGVNKRTKVIEYIVSNNVKIDEIESVCSKINLKQTAVILEAIEEITNKNIMELDIEYLHFAERYIISENNSCIRESSRIIGNMAKYYPDELDNAIKYLLINTENKGKVIRWSSAYALSNIIVLDRFSTSEIVEKIYGIAEKEEDSGVKNRYLKALKKISKDRK